MVIDTAPGPSGRVQRMVGHLHEVGVATEGVAASSTGLRSKSPDDIVIVSALRTPICRARKGSLAQTTALQMLVPVLKGVLEESRLDAKLVDDVIVGTVLAPGSQRAAECRMAAIIAGLPESTSVATVNRQCSSGLQAVADVAGAISAGYISIGIAAGVESMSSNPMAWGGQVDPLVRKNKAAADCLIPMGLTSENVATKFGVSRETQDKVAVRSHQRAAKAIASGAFRKEIVPVSTVVRDKSSGAPVQTVVDTDDGVRANTTLEGLGKLKPVFKKGGSTTAGNASQVSDGAAAVLLMKRSRATELGVPILGRLLTFAVAGVPPHIMGIGPAVAIPKALSQAGVTKDDIDVYEINEAFASQATYCVEKLGLDWDKVNPNGGAIALGHPLGCTGARMTATLLAHLAQTKQRLGVVSMCIGSGMGAAAVYENEQL